jgi:hypothetical protein
MCKILSSADPLNPPIYIRVAQRLSAAISTARDAYY